MANTFANQGSGLSPLIKIMSCTCGKKGTSMSLLILPVSVLNGRQNGFTVTGTARAVNVKVRKFTAATPDDLPAIPTPFHTEKNKNEDANSPEK